MLGFFVSLFSLVGIYYLCILIIYILAKLELFWVIVEEGYAIAITRNDQFHCMKMAFSGYQFKGSDALAKGDDTIDQWEIVKDEEARIQSPVEKFLGYIIPIKNIHWIGIPPFFKVYRYKFTWMSVKMKEGKDEAEFEVREEELGSILLRSYVYGLIIKNVELLGNIPFDFRLILTIKTNNPAKALFRIQRWLDAIIERVSSEVRETFGPLDYTTQIIGQTVAQEKLAKVIAKLEKTTKGQWGMLLTDAKIYSVDPHADFRKATTAQEIAKLEAKATIETSLGDRDAEINRAEGTATAIKKVNDAVAQYGDQALKLEGFRTIREAKSNITLVGKDIETILVPTTSQPNTPKS